MFGNLLLASRSHEIVKSHDYEYLRSPRCLTPRRKIILDKCIAAAKAAGVRPKRETGERVRINISGQIFETYKKTLTSKAGSIFRLDGISMMFDSTRNEYYFERNPKAFESILVYMQCGVCTKPEKVNYKDFIEELQFFGFAEMALKLYNENCLAYQRKRFGESGTNTVKGYLWHVLEYPRMDTISKALTLFSSAAIITSTISIIVQTLPSVKHSTTLNETIHNIQLTCLGWLTLETCARFVTCSEKICFLKNPVNILDLLSVLPDVIYAVMAYVLRATHTGRHMFLGSLLRILRITRLIPAYGSEKFVRIFNTILITIAASAKEFACFLSLLIFMIVLFSCLLYSTENTATSFNEEFSSVPKNMWFCVVTITSVGYGDKTPNSVGGKFVTAVMFGATILILTLPIPIIIGNFLKAHEMLTRDVSLETFYFDHEKSSEVKRRILYLSTKEDVGSCIHITVSENEKVEEWKTAA